MAYTTRKLSAETQRRLGQFGEEKESLPENRGPGGVSATEGRNQVQERYRSWLDKTKAYAKTHPEIME